MVSKKETKVGRSLKDNDRVNHIRVLREHRGEALTTSPRGVRSCLGVGVGVGTLTELSLQAQERAKAEGPICKGIGEASFK